MEPGLNSLLKWGIENTDASGQSAEHTAQPPGGLSADALRTLMGGPSDADLMKEAMAIIVTAHPEVTHEAKMTAFDNFEQLVESIDNANNLQPLGLWAPLISQLDNPDADFRRMAAWCVGTAVQNNLKAQEQLLACDGISKLCQIALHERDEAVRRKAIYALSSAIRNCQPAMDAAVKDLPKHVVGPDHVSAMDMDVIDAIMARLREGEDTGHG